MKRLRITTITFNTFPKVTCEEQEKDKNKLKESRWRLNSQVRQVNSLSWCNFSFQYFIDRPKIKALKPPRVLWEELDYKVQNKQTFICNWKCMNSQNSLV